MAKRKKLKINKEKMENFDKFMYGMYALLGINFVNFQWLGIRAFPYITVAIFLVWLCFPNSYFFIDSRFHRNQKKKTDGAEKHGD